MNKRYPFAVAIAALALGGCAAPNGGELFGEARHRVAVYDSLVNDMVVISCDARNARGELEAWVGEIAVRCASGALGYRERTEEGQ